MPADNVLVSCLFGTALILGGGALFSWHRHDWQCRRNDPSLPEPEVRHLRRQFRRRVQIAVLLIALGIIIPAGDIWLTRHRDPRLFAWYVLILLLITLWMTVLAGFDWLASRIWNRRLNSAIAELERKRRDLEAEASRLRSRRSNGQH